MKKHGLIQTERYLNFGNKNKAVERFLCTRKLKKQSAFHI